MSLVQQLDAIIRQLKLEGLLPRGCHDVLNDVPKDLLAQEPLFELCLCS